MTVLCCICMLNLDKINENKYLLILYTKICFFSIILTYKELVLT